MGTEDRKAKVTPETKAESVKLRKLWDERANMTQTEFGETYGVGTQSAVGQFLRGETPLSLKAAMGFSVGLGCSIRDFSPRLAAMAETIAKGVPGEPLHPEVASAAAIINQLKEPQRNWVLSRIRDVIKAANEAMDLARKELKENDVQAKRRSA